MNIYFDSQASKNDSVQKQVTIDSFRQDITDAYTLHLIKSYAYNTLWNVSKTLDQQKTMFMSSFILKLKLNTLNALLQVEKGRGVDDDAYRILSTDIQALLKSL